MRPVEKPPAPPAPTGQAPPLVTPPRMGHHATAPHQPPPQMWPKLVPTMPSTMPADPGAHTLVRLFFQAGPRGPRPMPRLPVPSRGRKCRDNWPPWQERNTWLSPLLRHGTALPAGRPAQHHQAQSGLTKGYWTRRPPSTVQPPGHRLPVPTAFQTLGRWPDPSPVFAQVVQHVPLSLSDPGPSGRPITHPPVTLWGRGDGRGDSQPPQCRNPAAHTTLASAVADKMSIGREQGLPWLGQDPLAGFVATPTLQCCPPSSPRGSEGPCLGL